jgi:predicted transcriptional regulator
MGHTIGLTRLAAGLALRGISRREAALLMHISCSALNKKLRGQAHLRPDELLMLEALVTGLLGDGKRLI